MIVLEGVSKRYRVLEPGRGLGGFVRSLVKPRYREITALDNISLTVPQGQVVASADEAWEVARSASAPPTSWNSGW